jgi:acetyl-CoA acetyltransferase
MRDVYVIGANTIKFGKYLDKSIKDLAAMTVIPCLQDANLDKKDIQALWFANSAWGYYKSQDCIRAQCALRPIGLESIPMTNVENACAGGSTAFHHAWMGVASGLYDITMALGAEKLNHPNKMKIFAGFLTGLDIENIGKNIDSMTTFFMTDEDKKNMQECVAKYSASAKKEKGKKRRKQSLKEKLDDYYNMFTVYIHLKDNLGNETVNKLRRMMGGGDHSPFMDVYAYAARQHMKKFGSTFEQLGVIASKNHFHSSLNPNAQYNFLVTPEQVLADRMVSWPFTRAMCAPIGDGAASAILCDGETVKRLGLSSQAVKVRASILGSGRERSFDDMDIGERLSKIAYEKAGLGPQDMHFAEVHDATAYGELHQSEALGFCKEGEGGIFAESGATKLGGKVPINVSGGLESRGHPIGASGLAQLHELVTQLRGNAGSRQVKGAKIAIAENGGGALGQEEAAMCIHILEAPSK